MLQKQQKSYADGETKWWQSLFENLGGMLVGASTIVTAANTKNVNINERKITDERKSSNAVLYLIIGLVVAVGIAALVRK